MAIVAVSDKVEHAGVILMWTLRGATDLAALTAAWEKAGLDPAELPEAPSPATALRRAVGELREKHRFVRAIPPKQGGGFAVVSEVAERLEHENGDPFRVEIKVRLDKVGRLEVKGGKQSERDELRDSFERCGVELITEDVSAWLVGLVPSLDGVALRGGGGVYFVPREKLPRLDSIEDALRDSTTHSVYRVPAINEDDDASRNNVMQLVLDSIETEAAAEVKAMQAELAAEKYGSRGYETRIERTDAVEAKVARYEGNLGVKLEGIRSKLEGLRAALTVAVMKAQLNEAKRSGDDGQSLANL